MVCHVTPQAASVNKFNSTRSRSAQVAQANAVTGCHGRAARHCTAAFQGAHEVQQSLFRCPI